VTKKARERSLLEIVYDKGKFTLVETESPDFRLLCKRDDSPFGVEVTELYESQSTARLRNIPGYLEELLAGHAVRHRDDIARLPVSRVKILDAEGRFKQEAQMITPPKRQMADLGSGLANSLRNKADRFDGFPKDLTHVNLLVADMDGRLWTQNRQTLFQTVFTEEVIKLIYDSPYREIFFVTLVENAETVYVPLRMTLLLYEINVFLHALDDSQLVDEELEPDTAVACFILFMQGRGAEVRHRTGPDGRLEAEWSNIGVTVSPDWNYSIWDHGDCPYQLTGHDVPGLVDYTDWRPNSAFSSHFERYKRRSVVTPTVTFAAEQGSLQEIASRSPFKEVILVEDPDLSTD
jgi:hypothetical protein